MVSPPVVQADHAMLAAAMRAKSGLITMPEVLDLVETVARLMPQDGLRRKAVRAFADRILLMSTASEANCRFAGVELHNFLTERARWAEAAE